MRACSTASGGVMFIPDEIERKKPRVKFSDLVAEELKEMPVTAKKTAKEKVKEAA